MSWEEEWEAVEVVSSLVDDLVVGAEAALQAKELRAAVIPFTVADLLGKVEAAVTCYMIDHDAGEPEVATAPNWSAGAEPVPAVIDTWSRGAVPNKRAPPISQPAEGSSRMSEGTRSEPPRSPRARSSQSERSERGERVPDALPQPDPKGPVVVAKPAPGAVIAKPKKAAPIVTATERRVRRLEAEAREEKARLEQLKAELKGRDYTYDAHANVIVMEEMSTDRLPAFQQQPRLGLSGQAGGIQPTSGKGKGGKGASGKGGKGGRAGKLDFGGSASFKQLDSLQPPLLETMEVSAGVLLSQDEGTKGGEPRVFDGERMSKEVFEQVANSSGGFLSRRPVNAETGADPAATASDPLGTGSRPAPAAGLGASSPVRATGGMGEEGAASPAVRPSYMPPSPPPGEKAGARNAITRERGGMPTKTRLPPPAPPLTVGHGRGNLPYVGEGSEPGSPDPLGNRSVTGSSTSAAMKTSNPGLARSMLG